MFFVSLINFVGCISDLKTVSGDNSTGLGVGLPEFVDWLCPHACDMPVLPCSFIFLSGKIVTLAISFLSEKEAMKSPQNLSVTESEPAEHFLC
jgi:hypothetical protein